MLFQIDDGDGFLVLLALGGGAFLTGLGIMVAAYRKFRYGEIFEYRSHHKKTSKSISLPGSKDLLKQIGDITSTLELD
jgi:hypothetical protein